MVAPSTKKLLDDISRKVAAMSSGVPRQSVVGAPDPTIVGRPYSMGSGMPTGNGQDPNPGVLSRALDVISRPLYAVANVAKDIVDGDPRTNNPIESAWQGLSGVDKTMFHDVIDANEKALDYHLPDWLKGVSGFAGDVALDPLTYTTFGIGGAASKGLKAAAKTLSGEKGYAKAVKEGKTLTEYLGAPNATAVAKPSNAVPSVPATSGPGIVPVVNDAKTGAEAAGGSAAGGLSVAPGDFVVGGKAALDEAKAGAQTMTGAIHSGTEAQPGLFDLTPEQRVAQSQAEQRALVGSAVSDAGPVTDIPAVPRTGTEPKFRDQNAQVHTVWKMTSDLSKLHAGGDPANNLSRNALMERDLLKGLDDVKSANAAKGIYPVVRTPYGSYHLDVSDIFNELGPKFRAYHLAPTRLGGVPPSSLIAGTGAVLDSAHMGLDATKAVEYVAEAVRKGHTTKTPISVSRSTRVAHDLLARSEGFQKRVIDNEIAFGTRDATQGTALGNAVAADTERVLSDPQLPFADSIKQISNVTGKINEAAKTKGVSTGGAMLGAKVAAEKLGQVVPPGDLSQARTIAGVAKDVEKAAPPAKTRARLATQEKRNAEEVTGPKDRTYTLDNRIDSEVQHGFQRAYAGLLSRSVHGFRQGDLAANYRNWGGFGEALTHRYTQKLNDLHKVYKDQNMPTLVAGMSALRVNAQIADPAVAKAIQDLKPLVEHLLPIGTGRESVMETALARNNIDIDTINMLLKEHGLPTYQFIPKKGETLDKTLQQWKSWDIKDPLDFLSKVQAATQEGVARATVGRNFTKEFAVDTMRPGYGKIRANDAKMSRYTDPDKYYPLEAIDMMRRFNNLFDKPTSYRGQTGLVASFANNVIDPYLAVWKPSATIIRPGHHIRNAIGDYLMNALYGVRSPKWYMKAANIQRAGGQFTGDLEKLASLAGDRTLPDATGTAFQVHLKGGQIAPISYGQAYRHASQDGLLPSYKISEDVLQQRGDLKLADKIAKRIGETKYIQAMGAVSETSSHHFRLAQYAHDMSNPAFTRQFNTVEDASNAAVKAAQKYHPDVRGLAPAEAKTMRRLVPFYTWFRQSMPLVFNSMLVHPGRVTEVPKAFIAAQTAMGIDPQGMDNPFPSDKVYPSFITQHLTGPLSLPGVLGLNDFSANLGSPVEGAADIFNGNIPTNLIGMLNPLLKAPVELSQDQKLGNGQYIPDKGEYIDQMLPFLNQVSNLSGYSASGTVANLLSGNGPIPDPQRAMQKGEKDAFINRSTLNFLTGLGIQDLDRPSYQKITAKEAKG